VDGGHHHFDQAIVCLFEHQFEHLVGVLEVAVKRGSRNVTGLCDQFDRHAVRAMRNEDLGRRLFDLKADGLHLVRIAWRAAFAPFSGRGRVRGWEQGHTFGPWWRILGLHGQSGFEGLHPGSSMRQPGWCKNPRHLKPLAVRK